MSLFSFSGRENCRTNSDSDSRQKEIHSSRGGLLYLGGLRLLQILAAVFRFFTNIGTVFWFLQTVVVCGNGPIFDTVFGFMLYL